MTTEYRCPGCGWRGASPSTSDGTEDRLIDGRWVEVRVARLICPRCFEYVTTQEGKDHG